jgi:hypothetical protein
MNITNITKIVEGNYAIKSLPCPACSEVLTLEIDGSLLYQYNRGASITTVLPDETPTTRERFISGYCEPCWVSIFGEDDDEDDYED